MKNKIMLMACGLALVGLSITANILGYGPMYLWYGCGGFAFALGLIIPKDK